MTKLQVFLCQLLNWNSNSWNKYLAIIRSEANFVESLVRCQKNKLLCAEASISEFTIEYFKYAVN